MHLCVLMYAKVLKRVRMYWEQTLQIVFSSVQVQSRLQLMNIKGPLMNTLFANVMHTKLSFLQAERLSIFYGNISSDSPTRGTH